MHDVCSDDSENIFINNQTRKIMEKKLQRDTQHKVIGGVCSGLANYFGIDTALVRVLFAIALLVFGTGFWLYVLLWILMPSGNAAASGEASYVVSPDGAVSSTKSKSGMAAGLILIGIGALGLLHRFVPQFNWQMAWPILLIILGILLIVPRKDKKS